MGYINAAWRLDERAIQAKTSKQASDALWFECEDFIHGIVGAMVNKSSYYQSFEDICQNTYFGFLAAVKNFQGRDGDSFITFLKTSIRYECLNEMRRTRLKSNGNTRSKAAFVSFEGEDSNEAEYSLTNVFPDPSAEEAFTTVESDLVVDTILAEVDHLQDERQRFVFREVVYNERPIHAVAEELGLFSSTTSVILTDACKMLRRRPIIRALYAEVLGGAWETKCAVAASPYRTKSAAAFNSSFSSVVEDIVADMEALAVTKG